MTTLLASEAGRLKTEVSHRAKAVKDIADLLANGGLGPKEYTALTSALAEAQAGLNETRANYLNVAQASQNESEASTLKVEIQGANSADELVKCARQIHPGLNAPMLENELRAQVNKLIGGGTVTIDNLRTAGLDTKYYAEKEKELKQKEIADADKEIGTLLRGGVLAEADVKTILEKFNVDASLKTKFEQSLEDKLLSDQLAGGKGYAYDSIAKLPVRSETLAKLKKQRGEILTKDYIDTSVKIFTIPAIDATTLKGLIDAIPEGLSNENVQKLADAINAKLRELLAGKTADEKEKYYLDCSDKGIDARYWDTAAKEFRTNRESTEQTAIKNEIAKWKLKPTGDVVADDYKDIAKRIESIGAPKELVDLAKAKAKELYDITPTTNEKQNFVLQLNVHLSGGDIASRFVEDLKLHHEKSKITGSILAITADSIKNDAAADWVGAGRPVDIYKDILKLGNDKALVEELVNHLVLLYNSQANDNDRELVISGIKKVTAPPVPIEISGPLFKINKEKTRVDIATKKVDDYLNATHYAGFRGVRGDFRNPSNPFGAMGTLAQSIEAMGGDKVAEDKLKKAVSEFYSTLQSAQDRSDFVTKARGKGLDKYINEKLWEDTLKDVEASKETIESVIPILADYVDRGIMEHKSTSFGGDSATRLPRIQNYFDNHVLPVIVQELGVGVSEAVRRELLNEYIKAFEHGLSSDNHLSKMQKLRKNLVGTIIPQMFPKFGLSPYEQYSGIAPAAIAVTGLVDAKGVLSLTSLKSYIETQVDAAAGVNISRNSREFPFIVQTITETVYTECMAELHDAKEIKKKEDEVDAIQEKKKKKEMAKVMNTLKWGVGFVGGGVLFGSGLGFLVNSSYWTATGSAMIGTSLGGLATVGKGLFEWFNNSDVKKLDSEWKMARAEFEIQKSQAVMASQKREMQIGNYFEGVLRDVFYPAQKKGREALFGRSAKMRQDMVNMQPPKLATFSL